MAELLADMTASGQPGPGHGDSGHGGHGARDRRGGYGFDGGSLGGPRDNYGETILGHLALSPVSGLAFSLAKHPSVTNAGQIRVTLPILKRPTGSFTARAPSTTSPPYDPRRLAPPSNTGISPPFASVGVDPTATATAAVCPQPGHRCRKFPIGFRLLTPGITPTTFQTWLASLGGTCPSFSMTGPTGLSGIYETILPSPSPSLPSSTFPPTSATQVRG